MQKQNFTKPVMSRAIEAMHAYIRQNELLPGSPIPSLSKLAKLTNVSYVTMCRAMQHLKDMQVVTLVNKHSYILSTRITPDTYQNTSIIKNEEPKETHHIQEPWQRLATQISQDILNRIFRPGTTLPSLKELQNQYQLSFRTVKKALQHLTKEGIIKQTLNSKFIVPSFTQSTWKPRIICINHSSDSYTLQFGQNDEAVYRSLEHICEQAGISLEIIFLRHVYEENRFFLRNKSTGERLNIDEIPNSENVLGYIYMVQLEPTEFDIPALQKLFLNKKPLVVLDETFLLKLPKSLSSSRRVRILSAAVGREPGLIVGQHLIALGHRKVAFISIDHHTIWSQLRLQGLMESFAKIGYADAVIHCIDKSPTPESSKNIIEEIVAKASKRIDFPKLKKFYTTWKKSIPKEFQVDFDVVFENLRWNISSHSENRITLHQIFEETLAHKDITAWVLVNDATASIALEFFKEKEIKIPHSLSIISFDDTLDSLRKGYSSFNFNAPAIADSIVGFMLNRKPYSDPNFTVSGFIVQRGSTSAPAH